jgi:hypothetical protein
MRKLGLVVAAAIAAGGVYYLSRVSNSPADQHVQGAIGAKRLAQGATVCVVKVQNLSGKQLGMEGIDASLATQLSKAGFKALVGGQSGCEGSVYGEIITLKGKDRVEAEVEFRLLIAGEQTPFLSSIGKGKSSGSPGKELAMSLVQASPAAASREAVMAAFADVARQIELQQPSRSTRASAN